MSAFFASNSASDRIPAAFNSPSCVSWASLRLIASSAAGVGAGAGAGGAAQAVGALLLGVSLVLLVIVLALLVPAFAVAVRRLHDTGRTGWWAVLLVVPLIAVIPYFFCMLPGNLGTNEHGEQPPVPLD